MSKLVHAEPIGWGIMRVDGKRYTVELYEDNDMESNGHDCFLVGFDNSETIPVWKIIRDPETERVLGFVLDV